MKLLIFICFVVLCSTHSFAQNVGINANGATPNASAMLDIDVSSLATKKGLLIPRITVEERGAILTLPAIAKGLLVYQTNGIEGFYYNTSTTTTPNWVYLSNSNTGAWLVNGNTGITTPTSTIGTTVNNNFFGTTDNKDVVFATNNLERMRITGGGLIGINTITPTATALLTLNPTTNAIRSGIDMNLTGATSTAFGLNILSANANVNGIFSKNSTAGSSVYAIGSELSSTNIVSGYNSYRNSSGLSYGLYGINGTSASYATNANTWAAFLQGRTVISSESAPTSAIGTDLEIRNTSVGAGSPVNLSLRQTTSNTSSGTVLGNVFFGDNHSTAAQAQISAVRGAAGGASDLPTDLVFHTTPDASTTLVERMRITNNGNVLVGTATSVNNAKLSIKDGHIQISQTTVPTIVVDNNAGVTSCTLASSASLSSGSNDVAGQITLTTGGGCSSYNTGIQCTITFNKSYTKAPFIIISPANLNAGKFGGSKQIFTTATLTTFSINFGAASAIPVSELTYTWNYIVIEP